MGTNLNRRNKNDEKRIDINKGFNGSKELQRRNCKSKNKKEEMIKDKRREKIDSLLYDFNEEYNRICVDHVFCIVTLKSMIAELKYSIKECKDEYEAVGIAICKKKN